MAELNNTIVRGNLRVVSQMEAQEILENGTSLASKYLQLAGGDMNGNINFVDNTRRIGAQDSSTLTRWSGATVALPASNASKGIAILADEGGDFGLLFVGSDGAIIANSGDTGYIFKVYDKDQNSSDFTSSSGLMFGVKQGGGGVYAQGNFEANGGIYGTTLYENGTSLVDKYLEITDISDWAKASSKPSYSFSGTAVTSGGNSGTAVAAVTGYSSFSGGSGSLTGNTTASGGIPYVEASLSGTELTLTVKYLHHGHTAASLGSPSTSNCAPSGHTHSVTAAGNIS